MKNKDFCFYNVYLVEKNMKKMRMAHYKTYNLATKSAAKPLYHVNASIVSYKRRF